MASKHDLDVAQQVIDDAWKDGGFVHPLVIDLGNGESVTAHGMSVRAFFAAHAITAADCNGEFDAEKIAARAAEIADALIRRLKAPRAEGEHSV